MMPKVGPMGAQGDAKGVQNEAQTAPQIYGKSMIKTVMFFLGFSSEKMWKYVVLSGALECKNSVFTRKVFKNQGFRLLRKNM